MLMKRQAGFGLSGTAILLLVVGLIGFTGWYVYRHGKTGDAIYKNGSNPGALVTAPNGKNTTTKEVKLSEFGIKFTVPVTLKNVTYKVVDIDYSGGGINTLGTYPTALFSTKELDSAEGGVCSLKSATASSTPPLGYLARATGQYSSDVSNPNSGVVKYPADTSNPTGSLVKQFSEFYLAYRSPSSGCYNLSSDNDKAAQLSGQLSAALKSAQLIN
jgi:hypothetical protein